MADLKPLLFPGLRNLVMLDLFSCDGKSFCPASAGALQKILILRYSIGPPMQTVHFTKFCVSETPRQLQYLDHFEGMKVTWKREGSLVEYDCGSGHLELLQLVSAL